MKVSKYRVEGSIVNVQSGVAIPEDEPIFILRARDEIALSTLVAYRATALVRCRPDHLASLNLLIDQFRKFAEDHPDRLKVPDTQLTFDSICPDHENLL